MEFSAPEPALRCSVECRAFAKEDDEDAMKALRRGWYLGKPDFSQHLMALIEKKSRKKSRANGAHESHGEAEAERLTVEALAALGVSSERKDLQGMRKEDPVKVRVAALLRKRTAVANGWIAKRLSMGHHGSVSRLVLAASKDAKHESELKKLMKMLKCVTCPYLGTKGDVTGLASTCSRR